MPEISPMRTVGALVLRDLGCTLRTPTVLFMAAFGVLLCWGVAQWSLGFSDIPQARGDLSRFVLDSSAVMPALTGGSVIPLSLMAEEREHGTTALLSRAGASMSAIAASKALAALILIALLALACLTITGVPVGALAPATLATVLASVPFMLASTAMGLITRAQGQTSGWYLALVALAMPTLLATIDSAILPLAALSPLQAGASAVSWLAIGATPPEGWLATGAVFALWLVASAAAFAAALRHRARQDAERA